MGDEQHTVHSPNGEAKIGPVLEKARLDKGLTLDEVEQATKIRKRYLAGLEREDYGVLPDAVYAHGFLKTYANYLGLDGESLSQRLKDRRRPRRERSLSYKPPKTSGFERPLISPGGLAGTEERKLPVATILGVVVAILALVVVIGALYYVGRGAQISGLERDSPNASSSEEAPRGAGEDPSAGGSGQQQEPNSDEDPGSDASILADAEERGSPPETLTVVVSVVERPSWVSVLSDGSVAYEQVAQPGFSQTFDAERELSVRAGDAGAVSVEVNGQDVGPLGGSGEVLTRTWTVKAAS
jgi:cytoskeletal protein RodZ